MIEECLKLSSETIKLLKKKKKNKLLDISLSNDFLDLIPK